MKRLAIVTGGIRGIGKEISILLKQQGYIVVANYLHNDDQAKTFQIETDIDTYAWDVCDFDACQANLTHITTKYNQPVDVLINNAGITKDKTFHKMPQSVWHDVINTNLNSVYNMSRLVIEDMRRQEFGRIINITSIVGQNGAFGQSNYAAAKAGVIGFTKALAIENASKGVTVNAIAPGYIETDMVTSLPDPLINNIIDKIPVGRLGQSSEVARAVAFLTSDEASFITGSTLSINGGQIMI